MPASSAASPHRFNYAGAVELIGARSDALIGYTTDGSNPATLQQCEGSFRGRGLVQLHYDPPCPENRFSIRSKQRGGNISTYCTFAPMERDVTVRARAFGRFSSAEDSAEFSATYKVSC